MPIYQDKRKRKNHWRVVINDHGQTIERLVKGSKADARAFEARLKVRVEREGGLDDRRVAPTFSAFCLGEYAAHARATLAPGTWRNRRYQLAMLIKHVGELKLTDFSPSVLERFKSDRAAEGIGAAKINDDASKMLTVLRHAEYLGLPVSVPKVKRLPERRTSGRVKAWSRAELAALLDAFKAIDPDLLGITLFMLNTGCRKGEALAARWGWIDRAARLLRIEPNEHWRPKNGKPREVPLASSLLELLDPTGRDPDAHVFVTRDGEPFATWPQRRWDRARKAARVGGELRQPAERKRRQGRGQSPRAYPWFEGGEPIGGSPHTCRHTFASLFLANSRSPNPLAELARIMGHGHTKVTELYTHFLPEHLAQSRDVVDVSL